MANNMILKMIRLESKEQKLPYSRLCNGICSTAYVSKCFRQGTEMDKLILEAFLQRLGISTRRYTFVLKESEYDLFELRERMRKCIWEREPEKVDDYIKDYIAKMRDVRGARNLHLQVIGLLRSYSLAQMQVSYEEQLKNTEEALAHTKVTLEGIDFDNCSYSEIEMLLILRLAMILEKLGRTDDSECIYEKFYKLQKKAPYNKNEFSHVFAKVNYEMAKSYLAKRKYRDVLNITEKGIKMLADGNKILYLWEMMEMYLKAEEMLYPKGKVSQKHELYENYGAIKAVVGEYYKDWNADEHCPMYYEYEIYSLPKMIAQRRKLHGETQRSISIKTDCNCATVERLERRMRDTQTTIRYNLLNEVGLPIEKCYYMLIADNMKVKRRYFDYMVELEKGNIDNAKSILDSVKSSIDLSIVINKQAIELSEFEIEKKRNEYTPKMQLRKELGIFCATLSKEYFDKPGPGLLYANEENIARRVIKNYEEQGEIEKAIDITTRILEGYERPWVIGDEFVAIRLGFSILLESMCANGGDFDRADEIVERCLHDGVHHDLAGMLVFLLYDAVWNAEKEGKPITEREFYMLDTAIIIAAINGYQNRQSFISCYKEKLIRNGKQSS